MKNEKRCAERSRSMKNEEKAKAEAKQEAREEGSKGKKIWMAAPSIRHNVKLKFT